MKLEAWLSIASAFRVLPCYTVLCWRTQHGQRTVLGIRESDICWRDVEHASENSRRSIEARVVAESPDRRERLQE